MEQPIHTVRSVASANKKGHSIALVVAVVVNAAVIWLLNSGLVATLVDRLPEVIKVDVVEEKIEDKTPPPPPPDTAEPPPPYVPPPDFQMQSDAPPPSTTITVQSKAPTPPKYQASPVSIGRPHTCGQEYPALSLRLGEQGTTLIGFTVATDGSVKDLKVLKTSGSDRLDEAAVKCASRWRYKAAIGETGQPAEAPWKANVVWDLRNR